MTSRFPPETILAIAEEFGFSDHIERLTAVLIEAEAAYNSAVNEAEFHTPAFKIPVERDRKQFYDLAKKVQTVIECLGRMPDESRSGLMWHAYSVGGFDHFTNGLECDESGSVAIVPVDEIAARIDECLRTLHRLATDAPEHMVSYDEVGRPPRLAPLHAITWILRPFWKEMTGRAFTHNKAADDVLEPQHLFLSRCAVCLGGSYDDTNIKTALRKQS